MLALLAAVAVLVDRGENRPCDAERIDVASRRSRRAPSPSTTFLEHAAVTLPDGRVLVAGGRSSSNPVGPAIADTEWFDPQSDAWSPGPALVVARRGLRLVAVPDGDVFALGGSDPSASSDDLPAERLRSSSDRWELVAGLEADGHSRVVVLPDGRVFVAGGPRPPRVFDPLTQEIRTFPQPLQRPRSPAHELFLGDAGLLADGRVAVLSGDGDELMLRALDVEAGEWATVGTVAYTAKSVLDASILPDGRFIADLPGTVVVSPETGARDADSVPISGSVRVALRSGGAAFVGGAPFDPSHEWWSVYDGQRWITGRLLHPRSMHSVSELDDGTLLVVGGSGLTRSTRNRSILLAAGLVASFLVVGVWIARRRGHEIERSFALAAAVGAVVVAAIALLLVYAYAQGIAMLAM